MRSKQQYSLMESSLRIKPEKIPKFSEVEAMELVEQFHKADHLRLIYGYKSMLGWYSHSDHLHILVKKGSESILLPVEIPKSSIKIMLLIFFYCRQSCAVFP